MALRQPSSFIGLKLPTALAQKARAIAQRDGRTLSSYVRRLIARDVAASAADGGAR